MSNAITGKNDHLFTYLIEAIEKADRIRFNVAFLMESGAKLVAPYLRKAAARSTDIQILTGRYMYITEPSAIYHLLDIIGDKVDIRFYADQVRSFHPKAYIFDYGEEAEVFIGSSNLSHSALTNGLEWNYQFFKEQNPLAYTKFSTTFNELFLNHSEKVTHRVLKKYTQNWSKPAFIRIEHEYEQSFQTDEKVTPRGAQIEALYELKKAREEGVTKGLVVAATGIGKTYLAAFDSLQYKCILFLAHREEILRQAKSLFEDVRPYSRSGFFAGDRKDQEADLYFATVQTLSREKNLMSFNKDYFDYIVIDEFHHAAAESYKAVLEYFEPRFLLGLTATPYRMDNRDLFVLCDDNVIYELYLKDAINRDLLVPFSYYGIHDTTDYSQVEYRNGRYVPEELERELSRTERANLVLDKYKMFAGSRALAFCVSIKHAEYMAEYFNAFGVLSACVHSGSTKNEHLMERQEAIEALEKNEIKIVFVVDIFNEGVDVPSIDTVMFLRPTESFVVFLQQLGRGLRKDGVKSHLVVLDFIGNYKRAHYIPTLLAGDNPLHPEKTAGKKATELEYPQNCNVHFDFQLLDLFEKMARSDPLKKRMKDIFSRIKDTLGRRPSRVDIFEGSDIPIREFLKGGWLRFLYEVEELKPEEITWLDTIAEDFLIELEKTSMTRAYKIPTIGALVEDGTLLKEASLQKIGEKFMSFYKSTPLHQKDLRDKNNNNWQTWKLDKFMKLAQKNPVNYLSKTKFFNYDEINRVFSLSDELKPFLSPYLAEHVKDILEYKRQFYFKRRFKEDD